MKWFLDTEFLEKPNTIDLISIALINEKGDEFYYLNKRCNLRAAWKDGWIREHVLFSIYKENIQGDMQNMIPFTYRNIKRIFKNLGSEPKDIASKILWQTTKNYDTTDENPPEFWGYFSDYDWVVFCWLYGRMINLPQQYPMFCRDLKQLMEERGYKDPPIKEINNHSALDDARWNKKLYEFLNS